jgi:hypothetical protein
MSMDAKRRLLSFLTVTALCLASVGAPPPAAATINPPISVEVQYPQAGACTAYQLSFATTSALAKGDTITITFPQGTILDATYLPADLIKVNDVPVGKVGDLLQPKGNRLTIPVPEDFGSFTGTDYAVIVDIGWDTTYGHAACITNPAVGAYTLQVSTSKDGAVTSGSYEISTSWRFKFGWDSFVGLAELYYGDLPTVESPQPPPGVWYAATDLKPFSPTRVDKVTVPVTSRSDPAGLTLTLTETGVNTGIFYSPLFFTTGPSDRTRGYLHVQDGDTLSASGPPTDPSLTAAATWQAATDQSFEVWANIEPGHDLGDDTQFALIDQESGEVVSCTDPPVNYYDDPSWAWCVRWDDKRHWDFISSSYHLPTQAVALSLPLDQRGTYVIVAHREGYAALSEPFTLPNPVPGKVSSTPTAYEAWTTILPPIVLKEDQEPPAPPTIQGGDQVWSDGHTLKIGGQVEPFSAIHMEGGPFGGLWSWPSGRSGNWSYQAELYDPAPEGTYTAAITARDLALNVSNPRTIQIIVDRTALPPSVDSVFTDSTSVTGLGEPGAQIRITRDGKDLGTGTADNSGHFQVAIAPQPGHALLEVRQTDLVGNVSEPTIVEVLFPRIPVPTVFQVRPGDKEITGVTQPGLSVEVYKGITLLGQTRGTANGRWGVAIPAQKEGAQLQVRVTDPLDPANAPALVYVAVTTKQSTTPAGPPPAGVPPVSGSTTGSSTTGTTTTGQEAPTTPISGDSSHRPPPPPTKPKGDGVEVLPDGRTRLTKMLTLGDRPEAMTADLRGALLDQCQVIVPVPLLQKAAAAGGTLRLLTDGGSLTISARSLVQAAGDQKLIALTLDRVRPTLPPGVPSAAGPALFMQVKDAYGRPIAIGALADPATLTFGAEGASAGGVWRWVEAAGAWAPLAASLDHGSILVTNLGFFLPVKP